MSSRTSPKEPVNDLTKIVTAIEKSANIRVMGTDTLAGLKVIDKDITKRIGQVRAGLLSIKEAVNLIKLGT